MTCGESKRLAPVEVCLSPESLEFGIGIQRNLLGDGGLEGFYG
jgi:hypothetical protein